MESQDCIFQGPPDPHCVAGTCTQCTGCFDAGREPDAGFVQGDAQTCPPPADVVSGASCLSNAYPCAGEVVACDGGIEATTCVCKFYTAQAAWACTTPICGDAAANDAAIDAPLDADAGD